MNELYAYQTELLKSVNKNFIRFLYNNIDWEQQMIGIKGPRGTGKTTLMLQHLKYGNHDSSKALYVSVEHPWFLRNTLFETVQEFYRNGGLYLYVDEVHKYENWSRELKIIYDGFPQLKVVFSASSALEIYKGEADLSRRVLTYELPGLSFREYIEMVYKLKWDKLSFDQICNNHYQIAVDISQKQLIIPLFREYLQFGYLPISKKIKQSLYPIYLFNTINTVIEQDLQLSKKLTAPAIHKLRRLLGIISQVVPFEPNISSIAKKSGIGRNTVLEFLILLEQARIINFLIRSQYGISALQKPDKIFMENTNLMYVLDESPNIGTVRETFLLNQLKNSGLKIKYPKTGDFLVNNTQLIEMGGKNKSNVELPAYIAMDDIEVGFGRTIPLWLFGFLY